MDFRPFERHRLLLSSPPFRPKSLLATPFKKFGIAVAGAEVGDVAAAGITAGGAIGGGVRGGGS